MSKWIRERWGRSRFFVLWTIALSVVVCALSIKLVFAFLDSDSDSISDPFEVSFGLNPTNAADASLDYDFDTLSNLEEFTLGTDPLVADTDRDQFPDAVDSNPVSRAYIQWGNPFFTSNALYTYTFKPAWWLSSFKVGGEWFTNSTWGSQRVALTNYVAMDTNSAWHVAASTSNDVGSLHIDLDRSVLTNNLRMQLTFFDHTNSSLYVDLYDTNDIVVVTNLFGNILSGSNSVRQTCLNIPLVANHALATR